MRCGVVDPAAAPPSAATRARAKSPVVRCRLLQLQIGLLASAKDLQTDLRQLAASGHQQPAGLQRVLQDTTLALLRQPDLWVYANVESGSVPFNAANPPSIACR